MRSANTSSLSATGRYPAGVLGRHCDGVVASSVLRATLEASGRPLRADLSYLVRFSTFDGRDAERTPGYGVSRLPGGHCLSVGRDFPPSNMALLEPPRGRTHIGIDEASERVRSAFYTAVECRVRARHRSEPNSAVGTIRRRSRPPRTRTADDGELIAYALHFTGEGCDESRRHVLRLDTSAGVEGFDALRVDPTTSSRRSFRPSILPPCPTPNGSCHSIDCRGHRLPSRIDGAGGDQALNSDQRVVADGLVKRSGFHQAWALLRETQWGWKARTRLTSRVLVAPHAAIRREHSSGVRPTAPSTEARHHNVPRT